MFKNGISKTGWALIGAAAGIATVALVRSKTFKKACTKIISAGMQLKDEAAAYVETVKEDALDIVAEAKKQKKEQADNEI